MRITSVQNPRVRRACRLRDSRAARREGQILIDGAREMTAAVLAGVELADVFVCPELCTASRSQEVLKLLNQGGARRIEVTRDVHDRLAFGHRGDGVVAVGRRPRLELARFVLPAKPLVVVLEGVEKPGNLGAVIRCADAAGASAVIAASSRSDPYSANCIRASLGTVFSMQVATCESGVAAAWLGERGWCVYAARVDAETVYTDVDFRGACAVLFGSEAAGLSAAWSALPITAIRLPMLGRADSLNVSAAAAVVLYEAQRQRRMN
jgi:TrmH family RNA methyltransferase